MPNYAQKITRLMPYEEFTQKADAEKDPLKRAFLELIYLTARRVSEILLLERSDLDFAGGMLYVNAWHLKKHRFKKGKKAGQSKNYKQVQPIPLTKPLEILESRGGRIFPWSRVYGWRIVKDAFPLMYPHYFRLNQRTQVGIALGDAAGRSLLDISPAADAAYSGDVSLRGVGDWMKKQVETQ